jgi:hypothetical protein
VSAAPVGETPVTSGLFTSADGVSVSWRRPVAVSASEIDTVCGPVNVSDALPASPTSGSVKATARAEPLAPPVGTPNVGARVVRSSVNARCVVDAAAWPALSA